MGRTTKSDWIQAAMALLVEQGEGAITVDGLTRRLGVTKGSFYHHFADMQQFKADVLAICLDQSTRGVFVRADAGPTALARLAAITAMAAQIDPMEVAVRVWGLRDPDARAMLLQIDAQRLAYMTALFSDLGLGSAQAEQAARLYYTVFLGAHHLQPPLTTPQMHDLFELINRHYGLEGGTP